MGSRERNLTIAFWTFVLTFNVYSNVSTLQFDAAKQGVSIPDWYFLIWESTSQLAMGLLIPVIYWLIAKFPFQKINWHRNVIFLAIMSLPFSLAHLGLMVGMRKILHFIWEGRIYDFDFSAAVFIYEYNKDVGTYLGYLVMAMGLNYLLKRFLAPKDSSRVTVRHDGKMSVVNACDLIQLEAAGNYVILHFKDKTLEVRGSLKQLSSDFSAAQLIRVHRSHAVAISEIKTLKPTSGGDAILILSDKSEVRLSRRFRKALEQSLHDNSAIGSET